MTEKLLQLDNIEPIDLYGVKNTRFEILKRAFPKIRIVARDTEIKLLGDEEQIAAFENKFRQVVNFLDKFNRLSDDDLVQILNNDGHQVDNQAETPDFILFGNNGRAIRSRSDNQQKMVDSIAENDMMFVLGPAGSGKTYTAIALAVRALRNKEVRRIVLSRPAVEAGERLGFLPGDVKEKIDPYLQPLYDALNDMIPAKKLESLIEDGIIQIAPLAFMRGRTLDNAFVILDEAQNTTLAQMKMFLTRMGLNSKFIITGDATQIDLPKTSDSGLLQAIKLLNKIDGISIVELTDSDIVRHRLVKEIVKAFDKNSY